MYSNPSNSDWSIRFMTSLWAQARARYCAPYAPYRAPHPADPHATPPQTPRRPAHHLLVVGGQLHRLAGELRVEVVQPVVVGDLRLERRQRLLLLQLGDGGKARQRRPCQRTWLHVPPGDA